MMKSHKHGWILQGAFATMLLVSVSVAPQSPAAPAQSSAPSSSASKPTPEAQGQQSSGSGTGRPAPGSAMPTPGDPGTDQIEADIAKLHLLAAELREEVGKTYKESLSVNVLKKAREIEALSKSLKERMDQKAAAARHR